MRVFAGPNGSGKSTIINAIREYKVNAQTIDFGIYINADDIAQALRNGNFTFDAYKVQTSQKELREIAFTSGLVTGAFSEKLFDRSFTLSKNRITLQTRNADERLAQILADYLRKKLLREKNKFSFETVFSHPSKVEFMRDAAAAGYKVYLYFISTEHPDINNYRIGVRVKQRGHYVPPDVVEKRYYRSLDLLFEAAQTAYQCFFFDNSKEGENFKPFAHFKIVNGEKKWDEIDRSIVPQWFIKYYSDKAARNG